MGVSAARGTRLGRKRLKELSTWPRLGPTRGQFRAAAAAVFGHAKQGASCGDTRAAGKQVLTNGPSSLAGAISSTAVPERSLGCGAGCAPFRRRRSTDDRPALATARTAGGADPCRAGVRFFLAEPPPRRDWCHRWARLDPGALSRRGGRSRRRRVDLMPNSQKSARPSSPPTMPSRPS